MATRIKWWQTLLPWKCQDKWALTMHSLARHRLKPYLQQPGALQLLAIRLVSIPPQSSCWHMKTRGNWEQQSSSSRQEACGSRTELLGVWGGWAGMLLSKHPCEPDKQWETGACFALGFALTGSWERAVAISDVFWDADLALLPGDFSNLCCCRDILLALWVGVFLSQVPNNFTHFSLEGTLVFPELDCRKLALSLQGECCPSGLYQPGKQGLNAIS